MSRTLHPSLLFFPTSSATLTLVENERQKDARVWKRRRERTFRHSDHCLLAREAEHKRKRLKAIVTEQGYQVNPESSVVFCLRLRRCILLQLCDNSPDNAAQSLNERNAHDPLATFVTL